MKTISKKLALEFLKLVKQSKTVFISGHTKPDGDTVGSALAVFFGLKKILPKLKIDIIMKENYPPNYNFLPGTKNIKVQDKVEQDYDLGIILECSDESRLGGVISFYRFKNIVNIDHHNKNSGVKIPNLKLDLVYPEYSSCAEIIFDIFQIWKVKFDLNIAVCLYTGVVTDTGKFQWSNTNYHTLSTAAELVKFGVNPTKVYRHVYGDKSYEDIKLINRVVNTLKIVKVGKYKVGYIVALYKMFNSIDPKAIDTEEFISFPVSVRDVDISIFFREFQPNNVKVSFRSEKVNVEKIARYFGGGGHVHASGAVISASVPEVMDKVLNYIKEIQKIK